MRWVKGIGVEKVVYGYRGEVERYSGFSRDGVIKGEEGYSGTRIVGED